jgi:hypothetical protein
MALDGRHIAGMGFSLDDARIAAGLISKGVVAKLYSGKSEGRIQDLTRQLVRMRTDAYLFWVTPEAAAIACELSSDLKTLRPDLCFLFWGTISGANPTLIERIDELGQFFQVGDPENALNTLLALFMKSSTGSSHESALSPYLTNLLSAVDLPRLGISVAQDSKLLALELDWLEQQNLPPEVFVPIYTQTASMDQIIQFCSSISERKIVCGMQMHLLASICTSAFFEALPANINIKLIVTGDIAGLPTQAAQWLSTITVTANYEQLTARAALYGRNGGICLHTGCYFDANQLPAIYHLEVPLSISAEEREGIYRWAASSMNIRSAAVLKGSFDLVMENLSEFIAPASNETAGWPKHIYAIGLDSAGNQGTMTFDGVSSTQQMFDYIPISQWHTTKYNAEAITIVTISTDQDAEVLVQYLNLFHATGKVTYPRHAVHFENSCRWINYGGCQLPLLRRLEVSGSMRLKACRDAGDVGKVGDAFEHIILNISKHQQLEEVRRDCASCPVRAQCSHCTQLPASWGGRYCDIRKAYPHTSLYFELSSFLQLIGHTISDEGSPHIDLRVSHLGFPLQHYHGVIGTPRTQPRPLIISVANQHLAWWRGTRKLIRLSAPLALMTEAWWANANEDDVAASLASAFSVDIQTAQSNLHEGWEKLRTGGIINA